MINMYLFLYIYICKYFTVIFSLTYTFLLLTFYESDIIEYLTIIANYELSRSEIHAIKPSGNYL